MEKEVISQKQTIVIMSTFIIGSFAILGIGSTAKQDSWLSILIAIAMAGLIVPIYARISKLFPGKDLYTILNLLFGKIIGKITGLLFIWYAFHLGALVTRNFSEFVRIVSLPQTPHCIFAFLGTIFAIWTVRGGIELLGRFLSIFFPVYALVAVVIFSLSIPLFDLSNLKPFLYNGLKPVLNTSFNIFAFPFAETVIFLSVLGSIRKNTSPFKIYYRSLLIGGIFIMIVSLRSLLVLGVPNISIQNFSTYASARLIKIGNFFQRIEASVAMIFVISGYTKASVCLYAATKGISNLFRIEDYHKLAAPVGLLLALFSITIYRDAVEMFEWARKIYGYYAIPFQIIIPIIIWITAEIKTRTSNKNNTTKAEGSDNTALPELNNS